MFSVRAQLMEGADCVRVDPSPSACTCLNTLSTCACDVGPTGRAIVSAKVDFNLTRYLLSRSAAS